MECLVKAGGWGDLRVEVASDDEGVGMWGGKEKVKNELSDSTCDVVMTSSDRMLAVRDVYSNYEEAATGGYIAWGEADSSDVA